MKIYIAGPISTLHINVAMTNFIAAETILKKKAFLPLNPMMLRHQHDKSWISYMRECIKALMDCESICMLPGWKESKGARMEHSIAMSLGMNVYKLDGNGEVIKLT